MKVLNTSHVRNEFSDTLNKVIYLRERIILERHGKEIAAIIPIQDLKLLLDSEIGATGGSKHIHGIA